MLHQKMIDMVIQRIFPKRDLSKSCNQELCNSVCQSFGKCCIAEKSKDQLIYVLSSNANHIFLKACPGSGKTEVVGLKTAYEFHTWKEKHFGIAILTFTNNAADVIRKRVLQYAGIERTRYPHFIGTMDSWLHGYLAHPFGHIVTGYKGPKNDKSIRAVEDNLSDGWINNYKCKTSYYYLRENGFSYNSMPIYANMLRRDIEKNSWEIKNPVSQNSEYCTDQDYFDSKAVQAFRSKNPWFTPECMRRGFLDSKEKFWRDGFATYHDIECICYQLLKEKTGLAEKLSRRFPFIIVDECQDLSWIQLEILGFLKRLGTTLHFVGDLNQAIYEFKKVDPQKVKDFIFQQNFEHQELKDNYRSCQPIVDLSQQLVNESSVVGKKGLSDGPACVCFRYTKDELSSLPRLFEEYLKKRDIKTDEAAILARGKSTVYKLQSLDSQQSNKPQVQLSLAIHLWGKQDFRFVDDALKYLGDFISTKYFKNDHLNSRRYYCPASVNSPMRWRLFLAHVLDACLESKSQISNLEQTWSTWAECVRKHFSQIVNSCLSVLRSALRGKLLQINTLDGSSFRALSNSGGKSVIDTLSVPNPQTHNIRIKTIHSVKGETFDAILLVSSSDRRGGNGGFWTEWLEDPKSEHARFAYVASSRPKRLLAWAIPLSKTPDEDLNRIRKLGFSILNSSFENLT